MLFISADPIYPDRPLLAFEPPMTDKKLHPGKHDMLHRQLARRGIDDPRVLAAMARVPRERFLPADSRDRAYDDCALPIDCGQTISQPFIVGLMTQALELSGKERVLEIGAGSGYQAAVLAELAGEVVSIERHATLAAQAKALLEELGYSNVTILTGDGTLGWPQRAPYDRIIATAAATECPPSLLDQLADGGILVIPIGGREYQDLLVYHKKGEKIRTESISACRFVPLIGAEGWPDNV
jgi:protein-L-isoaspartate(D-aspartate) O-methyltransferase